MVMNRLLTEDVIVSKIELESFLVYKRIGQPAEFAFHPAPGAVAGQGNALCVTLGNIPLPADSPAPDHALTVLYGFRDALNEMKRQYAQIRTDNELRLVKVSFKLEVADLIVGTTKVADLPNTRFLNLPRLSKDLQQVVLDGVNERSAHEGKRAVLYDRLLDAGERPDLICATLRAEPMFKHVAAVAYLVPEGVPRSNGRRNGRQVVTIFTTAGVSDFALRGEAPFKIQLPRLAGPVSRAAPKTGSALLRDPLGVLFGRLRGAGC